MSAEKFNVLGAVGAILAFCIGAGFATGQEVMQFFVAYGSWGFAGAVISFVIYVFMCTSFMAAGRKIQGDNEVAIFTYFAGRRLGRLFDWYTLLLLFMVYIVMLAGAGSVFEDYFNLPSFIGRLAISIIVVITVAVGFQRLTAVLGVLGMGIIVGVLIVAGAGILNRPDGLADVPAELFDSLMPSSSSWWLSGILYASFMSLPLAAFLAALGRRADSAQQGRRTAIAGSVAFCFSVAIVALSLTMNLEVVASEPVPLLALANELVPAVAVVFSTFLIAAIYTTAAALLWSICNRFTIDGSRRMFLVATALAVAAFLVSFFPFIELVNFVYPSSGWVGIAFLVFVASKLFARSFRQSNSSRSATDLETKATHEREE